MQHDIMNGKASRFARKSSSKMVCADDIGIIDINVRQLYIKLYNYAIYVL